MPALPPPIVRLLSCVCALGAACGAETPAAQPDALAIATFDSAPLDAAKKPLDAGPPDSAISDVAAPETAAAPDETAHPDLETAPTADASDPDAAAPPADAQPDAATADADTGAAPDAACNKPPQYSYTCDIKQPATCPGGACLFGLCIGPVLDPARWNACGDGLCDPCEPNCPADCGPKPVLSGAKQYTGDKTITVWVHGFSNQGKDKLDKLTYGDVKGCGDVLQAAQSYGVNRPCGNTPATEKDPNQLISVEYYGSVPPAWMSKQDIAEVEQFPYSGGPTGLQRYARVVAKFAKWRMELSGATHVQFACHSMGCLITRQLIEADEEKLASQQKIVRWATSTGVVAGAKLSKLFNNPTVQNASKNIGLELSDFILMNPDYVWDTAVAWDHKLHEANNPLFQGILLHHTGATKPQIAQAMNIALLDLLGASDQPNDGIMYTEDMYFWAQNPLVAPKDSAGVAVMPSLTLVNTDHMTCPSTDAAGLVGTAALFHSRKIEVRLVEFTLLDDREKDNAFDTKENGFPPAEVVAETGLRFNPYVLDTYKKDILVSDDRQATRTAPLWTQEQGQTKKLDQLLVTAPVLDQMKEIYLSIQLVESDYYPKYKLAEWAFDDSNDLVGYAGTVPLQDGYTFEASNKYGAAKFVLKVHKMY